MTYCGKRYKLIKIFSDGPDRKRKWYPIIPYDIETNMVLVRLDTTGESYWIPLQDFVSSISWPLARTGRWPDPFKNAILVSSEEVKEIYKNTVEIEDA